MLGKVIYSVFNGLFFTSYFDLVNRFTLFKESSMQNITINPLATVNDFDLRGMQAIHLAVERGNVVAVIALIDRFDADINSQTRAAIIENGIEKFPLGVTPLIMSIIKNDKEIFHYLCSKTNLDKDLSVDQLKTPLHFAAELGNLEMVETLILIGAKVGYLRGTRKSPFHLAMAAGQVTVAEWLANRKLGLGPVCRNINQLKLESIVHFVARLRLNPEIWIKMLKLTVSILGENEKEKIKSIPIIDRISVSNQFPLQIALEEENNVAIAGLIVYGADLKPFTKFSQIEAVVKFFGNEPINSNFINENGESIWHLAVQMNSMDLLLCSAITFPDKSNLRLPNNLGITALDLALNHEYLDLTVEIIKLYDHVIDVGILEKLAHTATWNSWLIILETLITEFPQEVSDLMQINHSGSLLHILATIPVRNSSNEPKHLVLLLLKHFPHLIRSHDKLGRTPLHLAFECGFYTFFEWLVEAKVSNPELDFNVSDDQGQEFVDFLGINEDSDADAKQIMKNLR